MEAATPGLEDDQPTRQTNSSADIVHPLVVQDRHMADFLGIETRKTSPIELKPSSRHGMASQYRRPGSPSNHRANLESWRMPHTHANRFERKTYDTLVWKTGVRARGVISPSVLSAGGAAISKPVTPNYLRLS